MPDLSPESRVDLNDFAADLGLSPSEVRVELAAGRLGFAIDDQDVIYTTAGDVLRWCQMRVAAIALFGVRGVGFPLYTTDWRSVEFLPDQPEQNADQDAGYHVEASLPQEQGDGHA